MKAPMLTLVISAAISGCVEKHRPNEIGKRSPQFDSENSDICISSARICQLPFYALYGERKQLLNAQELIVRGYFVVDSHELQLYPDADSARYRIKERALRLLVPNNAVFSDELLIDVNQYVDVRGTFAAKQDGYWGAVRLNRAPQALAARE